MFIVVLMEDDSICNYNILTGKTIGHELVSGCEPK